MLPLCLRPIFLALLAGLWSASAHAIPLPDDQESIAPLAVPLERPVVHARSALVVDARTGEVLFAKNPTFHQPPASTQKLLTALVVVESGNLDAEVTVTKSDTLCEPSKLYLKPGDTYTRLQLLQALLVKSGNDVARCLARDNAGSVEAFAWKMNRRARLVGAYDSNFVNPHGLPAEGQYSSARDMAAIAMAAYRNPVIRSIVSMRTLDFRYASGKTVTFKNTNRILRNYAFCNGMKTGYTDLAGHCLISSGARLQRDVIVVVFKSSKAAVWTDSYKLLSWALWR